MWAGSRVLILRPAPLIAAGLWSGYDRRLLTLSARSIGGSLVVFFVDDLIDD